MARGECPQEKEIKNILKFLDFLYSKGKIVTFYAMGYPAGIAQKIVLVWFKEGEYDNMEFLTNDWKDVRGK